MNTFDSLVQDVSSNAFVGARNIRAGMGSSMDMGMNSDTSSSYTDDEGSPRRSTGSNVMGTGVWSKEEHAKFLEAIKIYTNGPWKVVATYVGTRTVRQTMTHAQKYRQKAARRLRGLRTKQALMRTNFGHHVSDESLMQERLRAMSAVRNNLREICEQPHASFSFPETVVMNQGGQYSVNEILSQKEQFASESETTPWDLSAACLDTTELNLEDIDLLEDLTTSPTLEECATELLKVLF